MDASELQGRSRSSFSVTARDPSALASAGCDVQRCQEPALGASAGARGPSPRCPRAASSSSVFCHSPGNTGGALPWPQARSPGAPVPHNLPAPGMGLVAMWPKLSQHELPALETMCCLVCEEVTQRVVSCCPETVDQLCPDSQQDPAPHRPRQRPSPAWGSRLLLGRPSVCAAHKTSDACSPGTSPSLFTS